MDRHLVNKYFSDQCSEEELRQVLDWFQTHEGWAYLEEQIEKDRRRVLENKDPTLYTLTTPEQIFSRIQENKNG